MHMLHHSSYKVNICSTISSDLKRDSKRNLVRMRAGGVAQAVKVST
jgi:hypothetical protein